MWAIQQKNRSKSADSFWYHIWQYNRRSIRQLNPKLNTPDFRGTFHSANGISIQLSIFNWGIIIKFVAIKPSTGWVRDEYGKSVRSARTKHYNDFQNWNHKNITILSMATTNCVLAQIQKSCRVLTLDIQMERSPFMSRVSSAWISIEYRQYLVSQGACTMNKQFSTIKMKTVGGLAGMWYDLGLYDFRISSHTLSKRHQTFVLCPF